MTPKTELTPRIQTGTAATPGTRIFTTAELFSGDDEIVVQHNGASYRLRVTRQDKLILTK